MASKPKSKPSPKSKRKDGKPDRTQKRERNQAAFQAARKATPRSFIPKRPRGGQTEYTEERAAAVCELISIGYTHREACRQLDLNECTVRRWYTDDREGFSTRYVRARELQAEAWADDCVEDTASPMQYDKEGANVELGHRKAVYEVKRWLMGQNYVRRFGPVQKIITEGGDPDKPIRTVNENVTLDEAVRAYEEDVKAKKS